MAGDYQSLRNALVTGGADVNTLDILVNSNKADVRKDSVVAREKNDPERPTSQARTYVTWTKTIDAGRIPILTLFVSTPPSFNNRKTSNSNARPDRSTPWRPVNYGVSTPDDTVYNDDDDADNMTDQITPATRNVSGPQNDQPQRTLFFSGLSERTTYGDLMSVIKGGKIISSVLRNGSALVTFATGAADFLAWSKRNDIYLQGKRVSGIASQSWFF